MDKPLSEQLRAARKAARVTQARLADELGYASHSEISRIERGHQPPGSLETVDKWVRICGHRIAVVPSQSIGLDAFAAALADMDDAHRKTLRRIAEVLPHLPEPLRVGLEHDLDLWEELYMPRSERRN